MVAHANIPDNELHEPKGASSAEEGQVYRADGAGSGEWVYPPNGFGLYENANGINQVVNNTFSKLIIDHQSTALVEAYLPKEMVGVASFWDNANSKFQPLDVGDSYFVSVEVEVLSESGNPQEIQLVVDAGDQAGITLEIRREIRTAGRTTPYKLYFVMPIGVLSQARVDTGYQFFIRTNAGTATLGAVGVGIQRLTAERW